MSGVNQQPRQALFKIGQTVHSKKDKSKSPLLVEKVSPMLELFGKEAGSINNYRYLVKNLDKKG